MVAMDGSSTDVGVEIGGLEGLDVQHEMSY